MYVCIYKCTCLKLSNTYVCDREMSHKASLKQAAAAEIIGQLLNPSQSEVFESLYLSRVIMQKDLITENRLNRDQLVANLVEAGARQQALWRQEETAREIEWVIGHRMVCQLEKLRDLEDTKLSADREKALEISKAASLRSLSRYMHMFKCMFTYVDIYIYLYI
jgi:hypothetical protein